MEATILLENRVHTLPGSPRMVSVSVQLRHGSWKHVHALLIEAGDDKQKKVQLERGIRKILKAEGKPESFQWTN